MNRFEQRLQRRLQNPEFASGYREAEVELQLMHAFEEVRQRYHITHQELAERMGRKREAISRLFTIDDPNPTLNTIIDLLTALHLTADITLRPQVEGEGPVKIHIAEADKDTDTEEMKAQSAQPSPSPSEV
jgi:transcriptional regulator with XRE-family HTH domain